MLPAARRSALLLFGALTACDRVLSIEDPRLREAPPPVPPDPRIDTVALFDPATGTFHVRLVHADGPPDLSFTIPGADDPENWPIAGHWSGPGRDGIGFYHRQTGY